MPGVPRIPRSQLVVSRRALASTFMCSRCCLHPWPLSAASCILCVSGCGSLPGITCTRASATFSHASTQVWRLGLLGLWVLVEHVVSFAVRGFLPGFRLQVLAFASSLVSVPPSILRPHIVAALFGHSFGHSSSPRQPPASVRHSAGGRSHGSHGGRREGHETATGLPALAQVVASVHAAALLVCLGM